MRALIGPGTVAVMLALIQGEVGVIPAEDSFVQALRQFCDEEGAMKFRPAAVGRVPCSPMSSTALRPTS